MMEEYPLRATPPGHPAPAGLFRCWGDTSRVWYEVRQTGAPTHRFDTLRDAERLFSLVTDPPSDPHPGFTIP